MAKVVVLVVGVVMFALLALLVWFLANRFERAEARRVQRPSTWRTREEERPDGRHVLVELVSTSAPVEVLETRPVGVVAADAPDAAERLADLQTLAQDRARTINAQVSHR